MAVGIMPIDVCFMEGAVEEDEKSKEELITEVQGLRQRVRELEAAAEMASCPEDASRLSEERYRSVVESQTELICRYLPNGTITLANEAYCRYFGKELRDVLGRSMVQTIPEEDREAVIRHFAAFSPEVPTLSHEHRVIWEDGEVRWQQWTDTAFFDEQGNVTEFQAVGQDVTERKRAEKRIEEQSGFLANVLESLTHPLYVIDANDRTVLLANSASQMDLNGEVRTCYGLTHHRDQPCDTAECRCPVAEVKQTGQAVTIEHVHYTNDGSAMNVEVHACPVFDEQGTVTQVIQYTLDITVRKRIEEELRTALDRLDGLLDATPDLVFFRDDESRFLVVNKAYEEFVGRSKQDIIGKPCCDSFPLHVAEHACEGDEDLLESRQVMRGEQFTFREPGGITWYDTVKFPVMDPTGRVMGIGAISRNITEQKQMEEKLRASEASNRLLVDESPVGIGIMQDDRLSYANPALTTLLGRESPLELTGLPADELFAPEHTGFIRKRGAHELTGQPKPLYYEVQGLKKNAELVDLMVWPRQTNFSGKPALLFFAADISEAKAMRAHLLSTQKMEAIGTLSAGIAHEFNNLLTVVSGYTELLLNDTGEGDPAFSDLQHIAASCSRGADLVRKLRLFGRKAQYDFQIMDLNKEVTETSQLLSRTLPSNIILDLRLDHALRKIRADPSQVAQIIINLMLNAADAMEQDGILRIETKNCMLDEEHRRAHPEAQPGDYVCLTVSDTGHGMKDETLSRAFDPFFTTRGLALRSGLGLAVVQGIVAEHGGHITCETEVNRGTKLGIYLPAIPEGRQWKEVSQKELVHGRAETILLVEDESHVRVLISDALTRAGYQVLSACDGHDALRLYLQTDANISLVILDLIMPQMGGRECLENLLKLDPDAKVIVMTGYPDGTSRDDLVKTGARRFLSKPLEMNQLLRTIREVLDEVEPV